MSRIRAALQRRSPQAECVVWYDGEWDLSSDAFVRWGFTLVSGADPGEWLRRRVGGDQRDLTLIVVADRPFGVAILAALDHDPVEIWSADAEPGQASFQSLETMLADSGQQCSLLVDWTYLQQVGAGSFDGASPQTIAEHLASLASIAGKVVDARAYRVPGEVSTVDFHDGWSPSQSTFGNLREELSHQLERRRLPHTWVVCAPARSLPPMSPAARERGHRLVLWADEESAPEADALIDARRLLHGFRLPEGRSAPALDTAAAVDASVNLWVRLAYYVDCAQRRSPSARVEYARLVAVLCQQEEFGPTPEAAEGALRRAIEAGLVQQFEDRACRLNGTHAAARFATEVPERVLRLLKQMLQRMPWVSFKLLRSVLAREQWLGGGSFNLDESQIDDWVNFLIREGVLSMTKEPNLVAPEFPVTALRTNPSHVLNGGAPPSDETDLSLTRERAILAVDHFLMRQHKPWMSMGSLRRALDRVGREELQEVLRSLQNRGALITERHPNPQRDQPTTGCRLRHENPFVTETLAMRNTLVCAAAEGEGEDGWAPLSRLEVAFERTGSAAEARQRAWLRLLLDEDILELSVDPDEIRGAAHVRCRVNRRDPVVRSLVGEEPEAPAQQPLATRAAPPAFRSLTRRPVEPPEPVGAN